MKPHCVSRWTVYILASFTFARQRLRYIMFLKNNTSFRQMVAQPVEALPHQPEGGRFDSRLCHLIFHWHSPSGHTMALGSTQPLTEMSTTNSFCRGKGGRCVGLTSPPSCADCLEIWEPQPPGALRDCPGIALPYFTFFQQRELFTNEWYNDREGRN